MTDAQRLEFTCPGCGQAYHDTTLRQPHLRAKYEEKHMEIRYFGNVGKDKTGIRHPQFVRLRPDLDA